MKPKIDCIQDVVAYNLCCGCGICQTIAPEQIHMVDDLRLGRRPIITSSTETPSALKEAFLACPGIQSPLSGLALKTNPKQKQTSLPWGPTLDIYEASACDEATRLRSASGGAISALVQYAVESPQLGGALHVKARKDIPFLNETVLSEKASDLIDDTASRYAPASPCDSLGKIEQADKPCIFIGKPCDVLAVQLARKTRPKLDQNIKLTVALFCAGTPSTNGTAALLQKVGLTSLDQLEMIKYRGNGWPGKTQINSVDQNGKVEEHLLNYEQTWGETLSHHKQWRCNLCIDHVGITADIAVGDPWYRADRDCSQQSGLSLLVVRSQSGEDYLNDALNAKKLLVTKVDSSLFPASQPSLEKTTASTFGRILSLRLLGIPTPDYKLGLLFPNWYQQLSLNEKVRSIVGTIKRVIQRKLWRKIDVIPFTSNKQTKNV